MSHLRLTEVEIEEITGCHGGPRKQRNALQRMGIKAEIDEMGRVLVLRVWASMAAVPDRVLHLLIPKPPEPVDEEDIGMDLGVLDRE